MPLEAVEFVDDFVVTNPVGATDLIAQGDDHIRNTKKGVKQSFPGIVKATFLQIAQADVASGATVDLGAETTDHVQITGATTITSFGTVATGVHKTVRFAAALTLTHNGTTLILPGGIDITTAANDVLECYSLGTGSWIVTHYTRATGEAVSPTPPTSVRAATEGNVIIGSGLNATDVVDGVTLANDDLVLVKDQTLPQENGIYVVSSSPVRQTGYVTFDAHPGAHITVQEGIRHKSSKWQCTSPVGGTIDSNDLDFILTSTPVGTMQDYAGLDTRVPAGWLLCDGAAILRNTYVTLFDAVSTTYGVGDGSTTFNLPDARGRVVAGKDDMGGASANRITVPLNGDILGAVGGSETHVLLLSELAVHDHLCTFNESINNNPSLTTPGGAAPYIRRGNNAGEAQQDSYDLHGSVIGKVPNMGITSSAGVDGILDAGGNAHNNTQPTMIMNKIIFAGV